MNTRSQPDQKSEGNESTAMDARKLERPGFWPGDQNYQQKIAESAFFKAERRGFVPGGELSDWLEAEAEMKALSGDL